MAVTIDGTSGITTPALSGLTTPVPVASGGTGLSAVGASGNVLTSNGTSWVSSAPSGGVTSLNGQTGAVVDTTLYAIGSYVIGRPQNNTSSYAVNSTLAGSSLYSTGAGSAYDGSSWIDWANNVRSGVSLVNTGSWRCVSPALAYTVGGQAAMPGLWVRYA